MHHCMFAHVCVCVGREVLLLAEKFQRHKTKENAFALKKKKDEHQFLVQITTEWNCAFM